MAIIYSDKLVRRVTKALLQEQGERIREGINRFGMAGHSMSERWLAMAAHQILFHNEAMLPKVVPDLLVESVNNEGGMTKIERYHELAKYLGAKVAFLESRPAKMLLGGVPFLTEGIEIDEKDDDGEPIRVTPVYIKDKLLDIVEDLRSFSDHIVKYTEGMVEAYDVAQHGDPNKYREAISLDNFVCSPDARLYALLRMLAKEPGDRPLITDDLVVEGDVLVERYENFSRRYLFGPDGDHKLGEWSYIAQKPIDLILTTAKALVKVSGDTKHWTALLRFFSEPEFGFRNIEKALREANDVGEEAREEVHSVAEGLYEVLESTMMLAKKGMNYCGEEMYREHMQVLGSLGSRTELQRHVVMKYTPK